MVVASIQCVIAGQAGSSFDVEIDDAAKVSKLKKAIKEKKSNELKYVDADKLQFFLAKQPVVEESSKEVVPDYRPSAKEMKERLKWLPDEHRAALKLVKGESDDYINTLIAGEQILGSKTLATWFYTKNNMELPSSEQIHMLVKVPEGASAVPLPTTTALKEPNTYAEECLSIQEWDIGVVHKIPLIWEFMRKLGRCTNSGKIYWRIEDKQVVSVLVDGWFRASSPSNINVHANKKSIVMGSPGIGKSTLLCLLAFYLVFKHKKNVLMYRRLTLFKQENCLLYLGYDGDKVVFFSKESCKVSEAEPIYQALRRQHGDANAWLLLDGFHHHQIPEGLQTYNVLATSQQVKLKNQEITDAYLCLFPCWRKQDPFKLGEQVYHFDAVEMDNRYYYSGGSVRLFTLPTIDLIEQAVRVALHGVTDVARIISTQSTSATNDSQVDRMRRTFIEDVANLTHYTKSSHWQQMVDSEYAA
ncbi:Crinkler (CRN) family protein [Phytophthora infestans T30-4]|uniref:Crinkler (CRN) family protein n=1 Tax=Phytophthora infestans (strain T30-4) TaxID=403677 RepID=D0N910_PHYIT|nr:Crinkler (CRN) family protein [Phytophthora infestans T30-4]EEY54045.1 Crinkler (CRN) family protein [Phytophthora infestans T30-4]|eukprot:XP_002904676.1 Crinkler (CRN) family protein [Phytophthora infestans T30-4]